METDSLKNGPLIDEFAKRENTDHDEDSSEEEEKN